MDCNKRENENIEFLHQYSLYSFPSNQIELYSNHDLKQKIINLIYSFPLSSYHNSQLLNGSTLPGPLPSCINHVNMSEISKQDFWVSEKSDGERMMLYICDQVFFINRKFEFYLVKNNTILNTYCSHGETLLDGELVFDPDGICTYMIFDILSIKGVRTTEFLTSTRLKLIGSDIIGPFRNFMMQNKIQVSSLPFTLRGKEFLSKNKLINIVNNIHHQKELGNYIYINKARKIINKNDGIIFTCENDTYLQKKGFLLKWKWPDLNSIDFKIKQPFFDKKGNLLLYSCAAPHTASKLPSNTFDIMVKSTFCPESEKIDIVSLSENEIIVECIYLNNEGRWKIKNFRNDKTESNYITTVFSTMETIINNITIHQILDICK